MSRLFPVKSIVSYYFYRKSLREKEPCVDLRSNNLVEGYISKLEGLKITYKEQEVKNLTITKVVFWNEGAETINGSDITVADPLKIKAKAGIRILDGVLLSTNNIPSGLECVLNNETNEISVTFDYLDKRQGGVFQVIHTGTSSKSLEITGTIKGVAVIRRRKVGLDDVLPLGFSNYLSGGVRRMLNVLFYIFGGVLFALFGGSGTILIISEYWFPTIQSESTAQILDNPMYVIAIPMMFLLGIILLWNSLNVWRNRPPSGLEIFDSEKL